MSRCCCTCAVDCICVRLPGSGCRTTVVEKHAPGVGGCCRMLGAVIVVGLHCNVHPRHRRTVFFCSVGHLPMLGHCSCRLFMSHSIMGYPLVRCCVLRCDTLVCFTTCQHVCCGRSKQSIEFAVSVCRYAKRRFSCALFLRAPLLSIARACGLSPSCLSLQSHPVSCICIPTVGIVHVLLIKLKPRHLRVQV